MRCIYFLLLLTLSLTFSGCGNNFEKFQLQALKVAPQGVNKQEYTELLDFIKQHPGDFTTFYTGGAVDNKKVVSYLKKYYALQHVSIQDKDIWQGNTDGSTAKYKVNVYLENSASMNGFVGEFSEFKTTVFKLLTDLKNFQNTSNLNLYYINTKTILKQADADRNAIDDFYSRLNPKDFRNAGGNVGSTDIERMLRMMLDNRKDDNLNIFISDCVFSPGGADANKYLAGQYSAIYNDFVDAQKKTNNNLAVVVLQCTARFQGPYYDLHDTPHPVDLPSRPYYIWFIGNNTQIKSLVEDKFFDLLKGGYKNKLIVQSIQTPIEPEYKILYRPRIGDFKMPNGATGPITSARPSSDAKTKGVFGFNVAVDYSSSLQDPAYFSDVNNYQLSSPYSLSIANSTTEGQTHTLQLKTNNIRDEVLKINVLGKVPTWVYNSTGTDDTNIQSDKTQQIQTYGLKYLIEGVSDAFYPKTKSNILSTISIEIKK